jgi:hypothetical protein
VRTEISQCQDIEVTEIMGSRNSKFSQNIDYPGRLQFEVRRYRRHDKIGRREMCFRDTKERKQVTCRFVHSCVLTMVYATRVSLIASTTDFVRCLLQQ